MPMTTMLVKRRPGRPVGHSSSRSRATSICARISPADRLRTSGIVPVRQKLQERVQPTWVETQSAPRSSSGMNTLSTSWPSAKRSSHLRVPSADRSSAMSSGRAMVQRSASPSRSAAGRSVICSKSPAPRA